MKERLKAIAVLFTVLFLERFPECADQSNPYMLARLLKPLLQGTQWETRVEGKTIVLSHPSN